MDNRDRINMTEEEKLKALHTFAEKLLSSQRDLPEAYQQVVSKNFWELVS